MRWQFRSLGIKFCKPHAVNAIYKMEGNLSLGQDDIEELRVCFDSAPELQWSASEEFASLLNKAAETREGRRGGTDLVVLDLEFSSFTGQIYEIGIIEAVSDPVLMDTKLIDYDGPVISKDLSLPSRIGHRRHARNMHDFGLGTTVITLQRRFRILASPKTQYWLFCIRPTPTSPV